MNPPVRSRPLDRPPPHPRARPARRACQPGCGRRRRLRRTTLPSRPQLPSAPSTSPSGQSAPRPQLPRSAARRSHYADALARPRSSLLSPASPARSHLPTPRPTSSLPQPTNPKQHVVRPQGASPLWEPSLRPAVLTLALGLVALAGGGLQGLAHPDRASAPSVRPAQLSRPPPHLPSR